MTPEQIVGNGSSTITLLLGQAQSHTFPKGVELFRQDSLLQYVVYVESGGVKLTHGDTDGRENILELAFPGAWLGTAAVVAGMRSPVSAMTYRPTVVVEIASDVFCDLLQRDHALSLRIHHFHAVELCRQAEWMNQLKSLTSRQRVQQVIRRLIAALDLQTSPAGIRLQLPLQHYELAHLIAITPEHLSRVFKEMETEGVIRRDKGWIIIPNVQRLCPECESDGAPWCETVLTGMQKLGVHQPCRPQTDSHERSKGVR